MQQKIACETFTLVSYGQADDVRHYDVHGNELKHIINVSFATSPVSGAEKNIVFEKFSKLQVVKRIKNKNNNIASNIYLVMDDTFVLKLSAYIMLDILPYLDSDGCYYGDVYMSPSGEPVLKPDYFVDHINPVRINDGEIRNKLFRSIQGLDFYIPLSVTHANKSEVHERNIDIRNGLKDAFEVYSSNRRSKPFKLYFFLSTHKPLAENAKEIYIPEISERDLLHELGIRDRYGLHSEDFNLRAYMSHEKFSNKPALPLIMDNVFSTDELKSMKVTFSNHIENTNIPLKST